VLKINVCYWKEKVPGSYHVQQRFPAFLQVECPEGKHHIYGLPSNEYPGLMKVRRCGTRSFRGAGARIYNLSAVC
jgi:sarcosine oxidase/L-pipecolate oxidase